LFCRDDMPNIDCLPAAPLIRRISVSEVSDAAARCKNGRAPGIDNCASSTIRSAMTLNSKVTELTTEIINDCAEGNKKDDAIAELILAAIFKPGKPKGQVTSLRAIMLCNFIRKVLALIILNRIGNALDSFLPSSQAAYRRGRNTTDLVLAKRLLGDTAALSRFKFHVLGVDLSSAFDSPSRPDLMIALNDALIQHDNKNDILRLVYLHLSSTSVFVRGKALSLSEKSFSSTIGTPQGDALSGILFCLHFERALKLCRPKLPPRPPTDRSLHLPDEFQFSDDFDKISTSVEYLTECAEVLSRELSPFNLFVNSSKTRIYEISFDDGANDAWKREVYLGSVLDYEFDVDRRCQLANAVFSKMKSLMLADVFNLHLKLRVYNCYILSVLLYNCGTWGLTEAIERKLNVFHRNHLRRMCNIRWPTMISNSDLYSRCQALPLSALLRKRRWELLGHCLRLPGDAPAQIAFDFAVSKLTPRRVGRPRACWLTKVRQELRRSGSTNKLTDAEELQYLREAAADKQNWREIVEDICEMNAHHDLLL
jgi:hypothetical protein